MTNEQLKKELNSFSKEELIEAVLALDSDLTINYVVRSLHNQRYKNQKKNITTARKAWEQASAEYTSYTKQLKKEYKGVNFFELPADVRDKYIKLQDAEEQAFNELNELYDKQYNTLKTL